MMRWLAFGALPAGTLVSPRPDIHAQSNAASDRKSSPLRIDMQEFKNRHAKRHTAFAAPMVWMFVLASGAMQTLGEHSVTVN